MDTFNGKPLHMLSELEKKQHQLHVKRPSRPSSPIIEMEDDVFKAQISKDAGTWFFNDHEDPKKFVKMEPFDTIECQILENFKIEFEKTKDQEKFRFACLGDITVDIIEMMSFNTQ